LKLTVPRGLPKREIDAFLERQQGWLVTRLATYPADCGVKEGATIPLRGIEHRIMRSGSARGLTEANRDDGTPVIMVGGLPEHLGRRLADFLKREARRDLEVAVRRHTARIGRSAATIRFKDTKSRWGSCTSEGVLSFSWRIVMAPPMVIDYLAAHEVAHLKEMNHGPRFWALCEELCPEMAEAKAWLKRHGGHLQAVDFS
jgi:predicted metal-dependent hydrolase